MSNILTLRQELILKGTSLALLGALASGCGTHNPDSDVPWGVQPSEQYIDTTTFPANANFRYTPDSLGVDNLCHQTTAEVTIQPSAGFLYVDPETGERWYGYVPTDSTLPEEIAQSDCDRDNNGVIWVAAD